MALSASFAVFRVSAAEPAELAQFEPLPSIGLVLGGYVVPTLALLAGESQRRSFVRGHSLLVSGFCWCEGLGYLRILMTRPAPTVRPPSRIANRNPSSIAIGAINWTVISVLSPGITI
jgi:hypothetical protein